uniref:Heteropteran venom family 11 protein 1 n=1 Tax=Oncocephalus sp. TaxID=2944721 RepID=A0AB38ZEJ5_9HEMI
MFKFLILIAVIACTIHANVSDKDLKRMISKLERSISRLERTGKIMKAKLKNFTDKLLEHTEEDNGETGKKCFLDLWKSLEETLNLKIDESIGGYTRSSRSLINNLKNGLFDKEELERTKHMLSKDGSYFGQIENSLQYLKRSIKKDLINFEKTVHDKCCQHD